MKRPIGVTLAAVVAIIGSVISLLFAAGFLFSANQPVPGPINFRNFAYGLSAFTTACSILGIATARGLLNLRAWARMSILIFAGVIAVLFLLTGIVALLIPMPPDTAIPAERMRMVKAGMTVVYAIPFLIGVWWLIQFNTKKTKDAFLAAQAESGEAAEPGAIVSPGRPTAITIIAWLNILGGVFVLLGSLGGLPAIVFGYMISGWSATFFYVFIGGVTTFLGWGLLKLDERARIAMLGWIGLTFLHSAFVMLVPSARARMLAAQTAIQDSLRVGSSTAAPPIAEPGGAFTYVMVGFGMAAMALMAWFLVRERRAFDAPASP